MYALECAWSLYAYRSGNIVTHKAAACFPNVRQVTGSEKDDSSHCFPTSIRNTEGAPLDEPLDFGLSKSVIDALSRPTNLTSPPSRERLIEETCVIGVADG
jgi:hypothetical protein